jgi:hypothetical protein
MPRKTRNRNRRVPSAVAAYINHCTSRDGARKSLWFGFDSTLFAGGQWGPELPTLKALADEFGDEIPSGWIHRRIEELEAE